MLYLHNIDNLQKKTKYKPYFLLFYKLIYIWLSDSFKIDIYLIQFTLAIEKYWITRENLYNFDKKGFMIRVDIIAVQIIILEKMRSKEIIGVSQDENGE